MTTWAQDGYCAHFALEVKVNETKIYSIICVICLLFSSSFVLSSCDSSDVIGIANAQINENGELVLIYSDGSSIPAASAKGLRSAVSIVCNFQATIQQGGWRPGSSSTTTQDYSSAGSGVIYQMDKAECFLKLQYLHRCSQRKRSARKATSKGGLSRNVGQTTFA